MGTVIKVESISKQYRLGEVGTGTLSHDLNRWWARMRGKEDPFAKVGDINDRSSKGTSEFVWALKDINFEVKQGEILGIIGRNGAGKSTLLKILSKVTKPTSGRIHTKGRIASLLEIGTGFHPEMTGRENIFLNGAIMGMSRLEIRQKFDEIVVFAGVERYIDTPVKRYSSGMYVRLAFAVAAFLEPEILIVDEVLAVGDAEFQKKCIGRMKEVSENDGRAILFVSHDMNAISNLTTNCVLLHNGKISFQGDTKNVINQYINSSKVVDQIYVLQNTKVTPHIKKVQLKTSLPNNIHECTESMSFEFVLYSSYTIKNACFSFQIVDAKGRNYVHQWIFDSEIPYFREAGYYCLKCYIPSLKLYMGKYFLKCYFTTSGGEILEILEDICPFEVVMYKIVRNDFQWAIETCSYIENSDWEVKKIN